MPDQCCKKTAKCDVWSVTVQFTSMVKSIAVGLTTHGQKKVEGLKVIQNVCH